MKPFPRRFARRARASLTAVALILTIAAFAGAGPLACGAGTVPGDGPGRGDGPGPARKTLEDPSVRRALDAMAADQVRKHVEVLAADDLRGREAFSPGYRAAAGYVAGQFQEIGLEPVDADGDYLQTVPFRRARLVRERSSMTLLGDRRADERGADRGQDRGEELIFGEDYFISGGSLLRTETGVTAPVTFVGYGISDPALGWDDYAGVNVEDRIVMQLFGTPPGLDGRERTYYLTSSAKQRMAEARGATGILTLMPPASPVPFGALARQATAPVVRWLGPDGRPGNTSGQIRAAAVVSPETAARMFAGSGTTLPRVLEALDSGQPASGDLPVEASLRVTTRHDKLASSNVVGLLPGSDPELRGETVVLSAHLDHVGVGPPLGGDEIYNGAYDNASGVAVLIEAARALAGLPTAPRRSVLFAAVTAGEKDLQGSDYLAAHPPDAAGDIVADINVDMVLMLYPPADVIAFGAGHSSLGPLVEAAAARLDLELTPDPIPEMNAFFRSDQYSFARRGIPAVMIFPGLESADPEIDGAAAFDRWMTSTHHTPSDETDQEFRWDAGVTIARLGVLLGLAVASADRRPTWNESDFLGERLGSRREGRR